MKLLLYCLFVLISHNFVSQTKIITGSIKDAKTKQALPFCSINLMKTNVGELSDSYGKFKIEISQELKNPQLIVVYIGYKTDTIKIISSLNEYPIFLLGIPELF